MLNLIIYIAATVVRVVVIIAVVVVVVVVVVEVIVVVVIVVHTVHMQIRPINTNTYAHMKLRTHTSIQTPNIYKISHNRQTQIYKSYPNKYIHRIDKNNT